MTQKTNPGEIRMIPVDRIDVLNPRERNHKIFEEVVGNIKSIGLKKPITVTPRPGSDGIEKYLLVCGEGRLKAFKTLGAAQIPALVIDVSDDDAFIMSLAENIARVKRRPLEILAGIEQLHEKGYTPKDIAEKTGLNVSYVHGILTLLRQGEERLLVAVEKGRVPLTAAMTIVGAGDDDKAIQAALQEAYESGKLRGNRLHHARRIIEHRKNHGRTIGRNTSREKKDVSTSSLVRTYQREVDRQKLMVRKAEYAQQRLLFIVGALQSLYADENFGNLLRAEGLDTLPKYLAERVWPDGSHP
jgi:ParB family chromosome partitioning protein